MVVTGHNEDTSVKHQLGYDEYEQMSSKEQALAVMFGFIFLLFVVVVFLVVRYLYARWYLMRLQRRNETRRRDRSSRIVFYVDNNRAPAAPTGGLDPTILKSLPMFIYSTKPDISTPECAVCLSDFEEGEMGRILPKCKHSFHTECIDMWFHSNSTCPLCRSLVELVIEHETEILNEPGSSNLNIETMSLADRRKGIDVRIDVPDQTELQVDIESRLASPSHGLRSPGSRLLSRLLTMGRNSPVLLPLASVGPSCLPVASESSIESTH